MAACGGLMSEEEFQSWGWRVPFYLSALLIVVGLLIRLRIMETPLFAALKAEAEAPASPEHARDLQFDCRNTLAGLTGSDIVCPPVDRQLLATYFAAFIRSGFLEAPGTRVEAARTHVGTSLV